MWPGHDAESHSQMKNSDDDTSWNGASGCLTAAPYSHVLFRFFTQGDHWRHRVVKGVNVPRRAHQVFLTKKSSSVCVCPNEVCGDLVSVLQLWCQVWQISCGSLTWKGSTLQCPNKTIERVYFTKMVVPGGICSRVLFKSLRGTAPWDSPSCFVHNNCSKSCALCSSSPGPTSCGTLHIL